MSKPAGKTYEEMTKQLSVGLQKKSLTPLSAEAFEIFLAEKGVKSKDMEKASKIFAEYLEKASTPYTTDPKQAGKFKLQYLSIYDPKNLFSYQQAIVDKLAENSKASRGLEVGLAEIPNPEQQLQMKTEEEIQRRQKVKVQKLANDRSNEQGEELTEHQKKEFDVINKLQLMVSDQEFQKELGAEYSKELDGLMKNLSRAYLSAKTPNDATKQLKQNLETIEKWAQAKQEKEKELKPLEKLKTIGAMVGFWLKSVVTSGEKQKEADAGFKQAKEAQSRRRMALVGVKREISNGQGR